MLLLLAAAAPALAHGTLRFDHGLWFDGDRFVPGTRYSVEGALRSSWDGPVDRTVDLGGGYVLPPLADAHTHRFADGTDASRDIREFLRHGIFYAKNPNDIPELARRAVGINTPQGVDVIYSHGGLTSPGGHPVPIYEHLAGRLSLSPEEMDGKAYYTIDDEADLARRWPEVLRTAPDFIKVYLEHAEEYAERRASPEYRGKRGLDPALVPSIVRRAHAAGLRVSAHVATAFDFRTAVQAGVDEVNHLPVEPLSGEDAARAAERGVRVVTTTISHRTVEDPAAVRRAYRDNLRLLHEAGVPLALGTDSSGDVLDEIDSIAAMHVLSSIDLLRLAVEETPRAIFPDRRIGRLEDGFEASFVVLDGDPLEDLAHLRSIVLRVKTGHVLELPAETPGKRSIADELGLVILTSGVDAAIARYRELRRTEPEAWDFGEPQLNALGYALLRHGETASAVRIFELNAEIFPQAFNTWDSLAEACSQAGDPERAIRLYRKSLELNPENRNARERIEELQAASPP